MFFLMFFFVVFVSIVVISVVVAVVVCCCFVVRSSSLFVFLVRILYQQPKLQQNTELLSKTQQNSTELNKT